MKFVLHFFSKATVRKPFALILILLLALLAASCDGEPSVSTDLSEKSAETSFESASSGIVSEESKLEKPDAFEKLTLSFADILVPRDDLEPEVVYNTENESLTAFVAEYDGSFPAIADIVCAENTCFVCVVYDASRSEQEDAYKISYKWFSVDTSELRFAESNVAPTQYVYEKNEHNSEGYFWIDYEPVSSGTAGPYVVLYHEKGEDRTLFFEEGTTVYARIIRQNDFYAVLSLLEDSERSYLLIDREGKVISELDWVSDISVISPLMFGDDLLYCKTDSNEDYVYDTIGAIDLQTGEYRDLLFVGNSEYWTYFADGSGIAVYGSESTDVNLIQYYETASGELFSIEVDGQIEKIEIADGSIYGITKGGNSSVFAWNAVSRTLYETDISSDDTVIFGMSVFAVCNSENIAVYFASDSSN